MSIPEAVRRAFRALGRVHCRTFHVGDWERLKPGHRRCAKCGRHWSHPVKPTAAELFEDRGPLANIGRKSIPRSHRAEGFNHVD